MSEYFGHVIKVKACLQDALYVTFITLLVHITYILFLNCSYAFSFSNESIAKCRYFFNSMKNNKTDESIRKHHNNNYWFDIKYKPIQDNDPFLFSSTY